MKKSIALPAVLILLTVALSACYNSEGGDESERISVPPFSETASPSESSQRLPEESAAPAGPEERRISFLAAGDNIIHSAIYEDALARATAETPKYNFLPMYDGIAELIAGADISFINQETVMAGEEYGISGYPNFNSPQEAGDTLVELGFDIINIANNHMLDKKEAGYVSTVEFWKSRPVTLIGGYLSQEDYDDIRVVEYDGVKIAFLSYTYGTNGMRLNSGSTRIVPLINEEDILRQTAVASEKADLVFASIHWGDENVRSISAEQERIAGLMCENGVDVIIGHHPHVIQKMEWLTSTDGERKTLCIYSLGNLINTMYNSYNMAGGMVTFDIVVSPDGVISIDRPVFNPTMCHYSMNRDSLQMYMLEDYTESLCASHGSQLHGEFTLSTLYGYVTGYIPQEFLPDFLK